MAETADPETVEPERVAASTEAARGTTQAWAAVSLSSPAPDPNGTDYARLDYPQPRCVVCGRFAARSRWGWVFACVTGDGSFGFHHR